MYCEFFCHFLHLFLLNLGLKLCPSSIPHIESYEFCTRAPNFQFFNNKEPEESGYEILNKRAKDALSPAKSLRLVFPVLNGSSRP